MSLRLIATVLISFTCLSPIPALSKPTADAISPAQFEAWMQQISNWGRWGAEDELGTLNLIGPKERKAAAALVQAGVSISLSLELNKIKDEVNTLPFEHQLRVEMFGGQKVASDRYAIDYHGASHTHMDGLPHVLYKEQMYNGFPSTDLHATGALHLGIHNAHAGVFSRGVLIDMAWLKGVDYLEAGTAVTIADLEAWEKRTGIRVHTGDVVLLRTGRWEAARQSINTVDLTAATGFHASVATWLRERDVAAIGSDAIADVMPSGMTDRAIPLHELVLAGMGMPIFDNLDLDAATAEAQAQNRWEFLFVAAPLRIPGGTGSPLNPLAVF